MENEEINRKLDLIIEEGGYDVSNWEYAITFIVLIGGYGIIQKLFG